MALLYIKARVVCDGCNLLMDHTLDPAAVITELTLADEVNDTLEHKLSYELPANKKHEVETVIGGMCLKGIHLCRACATTVDELTPDDRDITEEDVRRVLCI